MNTRWMLAILAIAMMAGPSLAETKISKAKLGEKIANFTLTDSTGKKFSLYDLEKKKAIIVVFMSFECPVSNSYAPLLADLHGDYGCCGEFIAVCPSGGTKEEIAKQAKEYKIPFRVCLDDRFAAADALKAEVTPEAFIMDGNYVLRYRGRIDDAYYARLKRTFQVTRQDLKEAIEDIFAEKPVRVAATEAIGCPIIRDTRTAKVTTKLTFHRDIVPILQNNCQSCHRPGEAGPFSLLTYKQTVNWAELIKEYTQNRQMPPWKPVEGIAFRDQRDMPAADRTRLAEWIDGGMPEGNAKDAPPPRQFIKGWQLGKPDLILTPEDDFVLGATGKDLFRCYVLPTNLTEDKYVQAVEFRAGNSRVTHHSLIFIDSYKQGRKLEASRKDKEKDRTVDVGPGYSVSMGVGFRPNGGLGGWAPGQMARRLPDGTSYFLPKNSDVVVQVHYHRDGRVEKDRFQIGLHFADKPVKKRFQGFVLPGRFFAIPANKSDHKVTGKIWISKDIVLHSVMPHMHMLGRKIKVTMTAPGEAPQTVIRIDDWDYNWQETYFFQKPLKVKAGTRFDVEAIYDNSADNPRNPFKPPRLVFFGEQTTNEMCFVFFGATTEVGRIRASRRPTSGE